MELTGAQRAALAHVRERAENEQDAPERLAAGLGRYGLDPVSVCTAVRDRARVTLNFHPDRIAADGRTAAAALAEDGEYRSQYETRVSAGSASAHPDGERDGWERELFGGAYHAAGVTPYDRPRYGGLDLIGNADGASPRFGSCHLVLRPEVLDRTSCCVGDSHAGPVHVGTLDALDGVLAEIVAAAATGIVLGRRVAGVRGFVGLLGSRRPRPGRGAPGRTLDDYVEAQVHGPVRLGRDVEAVVADPSYEGTTAGEQLQAAAAAHDLLFLFHGGFELGVDEVDADLRGPAVPELAARVHREFAAPGAPVDAALLGLAAASLVREPERWADRGPQDETNRHLKQLWHVLVRHGRLRPRVPGQSLR